MRSLLSAIFLFSIIVAFPAYAANNEEGLYDPVPPEGSAFVHFIHADAKIAKVAPEINGRSYDAGGFATVKPYVVVPHGDVKLSMGPANTNYSLEAGKHYAAILQNGRLSVNEEAFEIGKLKSEITVYNLSSKKDVSLKTQDGKINVMGPIESGGHADREVNAIKVGFALFSGAEKIGDLEALPLERGESYVIVLMDDANSKPKISYEKSRISAN